jgi:cyclin-dependent kinase 12/13
MGCVQTKPSNSESNSLSRGVDMLKQQNGYVGKGGFEGERDIRKESGRHEYRLDSRRYKNAAAYGGIEDGGSVVDRREERDAGGNFWKKEMELKPNIEAVELVYGWPKWLTDNVPREVLSGLVAKTADSYVMLSKVYIFLV